MQRLLSGRMPGLPRLGFSFVDVRDAADLHIRAMTAPEAQKLLGWRPRPLEETVLDCARNLIAAQAI